MAITALATRRLIGHWLDAHSYSTVAIVMKIDHILEPAAPADNTTVSFGEG